MFFLKYKHFSFYPLNYKIMLPNLTTPLSLKKMNYRGANTSNEIISNVKLCFIFQISYTSNLYKLIHKFVGTERLSVVGFKSI